MKKFYNLRIRARSRGLSFGFSFPLLPQFVYASSGGSGGDTASMRRLL